MLLQPQHTSPDTSESPPSAISFPTWSPNLRRPEQPKAKSWPSSLYR
ncbi:unnamed protein product [Nyctereutes procyonoides]|uniref:(raccoon dog) hypothetical protein n=1 Tax=Nyctereutes procyonoides TaxID=34880 RepID=A0A811YXK8_NYCPR|nr:unnamed protein product [Nyctereutes procyonoides]